MHQLCDSLIYVLLIETLIYEPISWLNTGVD